MFRQLSALTVLLTLTALPGAVFAETTPATSNSSLIAELTQLVQVLEQELQQLLTQGKPASAQKEPASVPSNPSFTASPISGAAPLYVSFFVNAHQVSDEVDFGDNSSPEPFDEGCSSPSNICDVSHTYTLPSVYIATLKDSSGNVLASQTITVITGTSTPSATIDQSSLTTPFSYPTITGTAVNIPELEIDLKGFPSQGVAVIRGTWSATLPIPGSGSYPIQLVNPATGVVLTTATLTITPRIMLP
jgi:PKD repeat protein